jgi:spermidine/putrescine transport system substrate-binding protein
VAEGQNYPPSLDPSKVALTDKIKKMPAFDPTGKLEGYLFANPAYWNANQVEWTEKWDRIKAGS